jgi:hypothetical protein
MTIRFSRRAVLHGISTIRKDVIRIGNPCGYKYVVKTDKQRRKDQSGEREMRRL